MYHDDRPLLFSITRRWEYAPPLPGRIPTPPPIGSRAPPRIVRRPGCCPRRIQAIRITDLLRSPSTTLAGASRLRVWAVVLGLQAALALLMVLDWRYSVGLVLGMALLFMILEWPVLGVTLLVMARVADTAQNAFFRIGGTAIGIFELSLLLALIALLVHVVRSRRRLMVEWPWAAPLLAFMGWQIISLAWSADRADGMGEIIPMMVVLANILLILHFIRTPRDVVTVLIGWVIASVAVGGLSILGGWLGILDAGDWQAAQGGGRSTGLGQQPNWYAMNLMFIVHTSFALALMQRRRLFYWLLIFAGLFVFVAQMGSGSRGGTYAIIIGGLLTALAQPVFRKWFLRFVIFAVLVFVVSLTLDLGPTSQAVHRIYSNLAHTWSNIRGLNWVTCFQMFQDTYGRGIGAGGYVTLLPEYSWFIYNSVYRYPHGIFWGLLAHYGVVGLALAAWLVVIVVKMGRDLGRWTRGTALNLLAWTMPATMFGYAAWSFVEFSFYEKPFWEFLAVYTALYLAVRERMLRGEQLPAPVGIVASPELPATAGASLSASPGRSTRSPP